MISPFSSRPIFRAHVRPALRVLAWVGTLALPLIPARAQNAVGSIISYQGQLSDTAGKPLADGTTSLTFKIYEAGAVVSSQTMSVATVGGVFSTFLSVGTLTFDPTKAYELGITFNGVETRHPIAAVPVALTAKSAATATNISGIVPIANGGTGSATQPFVDLTTAQTIAGAKTFSDAVRGNSSFLMNGTTGSIPIEGAGTRMMWVPGKSAFRAGYSDGSQWDDANIGQYSTALGFGTTASGESSTAMGRGTTASGQRSTAMGDYTVANGLRSTAMGVYTTASADGSTAMGAETIASGAYSTAMGYSTTASKYASVAMGQNATVSHLRSVVMGLSPTATASDRDNQFKVRAPGGVTFLSNTGTTGVELAPGAGTWSTLSDRNAKDRFGTIDPRDVLRRVSSLPLSSWNYKGNDSRHIGPMAQDFRAAFGLGMDERHIDSVDVDGVALAAIQGLNSELQDTKSQLQMRDAKIAALETRLKKLEGAAPAVR